MFREKKQEDSGELGMFTNIDRNVVVQDARAFNETPLNARRCCNIVTKTLYLLYQGEPFSATEATSIFFAIIKSFQSKDPCLRRLTYLVIKELARIAQDILMVTSSLTQDFTTRPEVLFRANAIRALGRVIDPSMISGIERFIKQAMMDKNTTIASAALVTSIHFFESNRDAVKRWLAEIQQSLTSAAGKSITQYHALGLLYLIKQNDRMALMKLVQQMHSNAGNPFATCLFLRIYAQLVAKETLNSGFTPLDLKPYLRYKGKNDMVALEAARVICELSEIYPQDILYAVTALQMFLSSSKPLLRFAAIRTLNGLAMNYPQKVATCNLDIEALITDSNRNVATLAITTLLKTGNESSVERLVTQITSYVSEISDEFKVIVVDAVRSLCLKFPAKYSIMLNFFGSVLRDEGGYEYKRATVESICELIEKVPDSKEAALAHLCEFIEDCEYPKLTVRVIHLIGMEGPSTSSPSKLVRYIYNRLILENASVRVASIGSLAKFATELPSLKAGIVTILRRCLNDPDDEVRDRAVICLRSLEEQQDIAKRLLNPDFSCDFTALEEQLLRYTQNGKNFNAPFDFSKVPTITRSEVFASMASNSEQLVPIAATPTEQFGAQAKATAMEAAMSMGASALRNIPEFSQFGNVFKSSRPVELTEVDTEYVVACVKHIFVNHIVLEFICRNTFREQFLENVRIDVHVESAVPFIPVVSIPIDQLPFDEPRSSYVAFAYDSKARPAAVLSCTLKFVARECDHETFEPYGTGYEEEYSIESAELGLGDYVRGREVFDFQSEWEKMGPSCEIGDTFALTAMSSIKAAVEALLEIIGGRPIGGTDAVESHTPLHTLLISGNLLTSASSSDASNNAGCFLTKCRLVLASNGAAGVNLEMVIRSNSVEVSQMVAQSLG